MDIKLFVELYPDCALDFSAPIKKQKRVYNEGLLCRFPRELEPSFDVGVRRGRGRPNLNQTRTHWQCTNCKRVLRNDCFHTPPSMKARNAIFSHCRECAQQRNAKWYAENGQKMVAARIAIWDFIAPCCSVCGFDRHSSAMDMHHVGKKEEQISILVAQFAASKTERNALQLLKEVSKCVPLCSNCHRMLHAGAITVDGLRPLKYGLRELLECVG